MTMKEVTGHDEDVNFVKFDKVGDFVEGIYSEVKECKYGKLYTITDKDSKPQLIFGKLDLDRKMAKITTGSLVCITLDKLEKTKKGEMKIFKVTADDGKAQEEIVQ